MKAGRVSLSAGIGEAVRGRLNCVQAPGYHQRLPEAFLAPMWVSCAPLGSAERARPGLLEEKTRQGLLAAHPEPRAQHPH